MPVNRASLLSLPHGYVWIFRIPFPHQFQELAEIFLGLHNLRHVIPVGQR